MTNDFGMDGGNAVDDLAHQEIGLLDHSSWLGRGKSDATSCPGAAPVLRSTAVKPWLRSRPVMT